MNEKQLVDVSIILGILGIVVLFFISENIELEETKINEIDKNKLNEQIRIQGKVKNIIEKDKITLITIENQCTSLIVSFDDVSIKEGDNIEVIGNIREYKGQTEVVAEKIKKV